ncbi:MAG: DM13 domain-containing protein [Streptosporangiaceae bacterium]
MRRRGGAAVIAVAGVLVLVAALVAFQPWKLWVDDKASDADVVAVSEPARPRAAEPSAAQERKVTEKVFEGRHWRSYSHGETSGKVKLYQQPDGSHVLRLEDLSTSNGPDLKVVLSDKPYDQVAELGPDYLTLATLKGNIGDSNYTVTAGTDLTKYKSAVIWCKRFDAVFAAISLA